MDLLKPLIALLAIVNPDRRGALFHPLHAEPSAAERSARSASVVHGLRGDRHQRTGRLKIIEFFGISLASFQVGGGTLLLISSLAMLNAQPAESKPGDMSEGDEKVDAGASIAVVPLTIPCSPGRPPSRPW
jgi:multiple antibiotic resistance protein